MVKIFRGIILKLVFVLIRNEKVKLNDPLITTGLFSDYLLALTTYVVYGRNPFIVIRYVLKQIILMKYPATDCSNFFSIVVGEIDFMLV